MYNCSCSSCASSCSSSCSSTCNSCGNWTPIEPRYPASSGCSCHRPAPYHGMAQEIDACPAMYSDAGYAGGATLVIHKIVLEPCGNQSCRPRTFSLRITGPSYPTGEVFQLRAGNCLELDEPLVIAGLEPGTYCIEELFATPHEYVSTYTGPVCGRSVTLSASYMPTVVTIVNRKRLCRLCQGYGCGCGCSACSICR